MLNKPIHVNDNEIVASHGGVLKVPLHKCGLKTLIGRNPSDYVYSAPLSNTHARTQNKHMTHSSSNHMKVSIMVSLWYRYGYRYDP